MSDPRPLAGRTILMSGGSRGIGLAIALRAARDGANVAFVAKTDKPDPRLPGTIHTAAAEIEEAGGKALPILGDIRSTDSVIEAVNRTVEQFGGIDIVVNNASAIALDGFGKVTPKRYDLMLDINARGTFLLTSAALPHLLESPAPRVLTLSPPINLDRKWFGAHAPYTVSKYAMTMLTLGLAEQYRHHGLAANCLWPRTLIATAAVQNIVGGDDGMRAARRPEIMSDAAHLVLTGSASGECYLDDDVLRAHGVTDFAEYRYGTATEDQLQTDLFL
ncbi:SDR family oxidoreductase [Amycolatopsis circi]|uniref:SDR family oxidoreductase n=1 Tax=Amycolatopsis circi TaxID=871959 RepID=UPI000E243F43|nr:NAD(P)-dependent oxidoreductase [Amycolatopsis circi]